MRQGFRPADLGDFGLRHEVNVFVFRQGRRGVEYLLLQSGPAFDSLWRPVVRAVDLDEDLRRAAVRGVQSQTGLDQAFHLITPETAIVQTIGDLQLVGWPFGFMLRQPWSRALRKRGSKGLQWLDFQKALLHLSASGHRQNLLQVHWKVRAA
ncbi:MAG: hypothetical protein DWQ01_20710 [Planctomycetota bacterium]|nr:MAG: hypothetical protein DWQ01_20710 [Planctomycetota bacterium]